MNFNLPDIGEGIKDVTVTDILVKENQELNENDNIIIVESEKTSMEIPIDTSGKVKKIHINIGSKISPGNLILSLYSGNLDTIPKEEINNPKEEKKDFDDNKIQEDVIESNQKIEKSNNLENTNIVYASPSVRKLARELNCNLNEIKGTGKNGRITLEDVKNNKNNLSDISLDFDNKIENVDGIYNSCSKWGLCEKIRLNNIKITTGKRLHQSWSSIPHVTQFDECDITELDKIRNIIKNKDKDSKVSFISFFVKAAAIGLRDLPLFNTSLSETKDYMIQKNYYNIGVAVDTDRGLVVPVIKNVDKKSIKQINTELLILINKAKNKRLTIDDMSGGCFTITSLGGIGGKFFTPIINPPEVAILGISKMDIKPVFIKNKFKARKILPISLSYDHRIIDGAAAATFTNLFSKLISSPKLLNG
jgi:pyruvate dehydrogenase E2 component (dihydrolipoamide acetyltransferase)